ncbi:MAG: hypothetical protein NC218_08410 [Acetobacter sp.]|nr:hypothetical protein [Acetobacter sp.]
MGAISCTTARHFAEAYIRGELSNKLHDEITDHITACKKCFNFYVETARDLGEIMIVDHSDSRKIKEEKSKPVAKINRGVYNLYDTWVDAAKATDLSLLMQLKAVRDSVTENYDVPEGESEIFRDFGMFIIKKICQKIDHLNACYKLEVNEEKPNEKSK